MLRSLAFVATTVLVTAPCSLAQAPTESAAKKSAPTVGSAAPALKVEKWLKGTPVPQFEKGKVYVVEFWATWCGPCIRSMPHISELQHQYKDKGVTIIGVSSLDQRGNTLEASEKMVADKGEGMAYTVAWDSTRATYDAYMKPAGRNGIPCSYVIDKQGQIAYVGHPLFLDEPLAGVLDGTWKSTERAESYQALQDEYWPMLATAKKDPRAALEYATKFEREHPVMAGLVRQMRFDAALSLGDMETVREIGGKLVDKAITAKDPNTLNMIAWGLVDPEAKMEKRELELAFKAAEKAVELTESKNGAMLDTLARCYAWKGDYKKAHEVQTKAMSLANANVKAQMQAALDEYQQKLDSK